MAPDKVTVAARDSYWSIAQRVYGNGQYFRALHQYNADKGITELSAGITISVPPISELEKKHPGLCPDSENKSAKSKSDQKPPKQGNPRPDEYITSQGDTLFSIAAEQLGQAARYIEIIKLNIDRLPKNANHLTRPRPGLRLRMPKR
jgi:nucleoid-associated protein YgaU